MCHLRLRSRICLVVGIDETCQTSKDEIKLFGVLLAARFVPLDCGLIYLVSRKGQMSDPDEDRTCQSRTHAFATARPLMPLGQSNS